MRQGDRSVAAASTFQWVRADTLSRTYLLQGDHRTLASFSVQGFFRPEGFGEISGRAWYFEPLDADDGTLVVRKQGPCKDVATFDLNASSGRGLLQICDGRTFVFRSDFWKGSAEFQTMAGEPLVQFRFRGVIRRSAKVEFRAAVDLTSDRIWLAMLGWCIILGYL